MKKLIRNKMVPMTLVFILLLNFVIILPNKAQAAPNIPSLLPKPVSYTAGTGHFTLTSNTSIYVAGNTQDETDEIYDIAQSLVAKLNISTGFNISVIKSNTPKAGSIYFTTIGGTSDQGNEGYKLVTDTNKVTLTAYKPEGIFRGMQTLIQLFPAEILKSTVVTGVRWVIPCSTINDKPSYSYRGLMIDVARHFFTVEQIKRQIDLASQYKINKLHLHLSDDQGWRIEIKSRPDLITYGSISAVNRDPGGYYTQDQFKDIVSYASARYVEVIPEIDMPGHTNAALASIPELNPTGVRAKPRYDIAVGYSSLMARSEATYDFVDDVIRELAAISPSPYIHIGGDESHSTSAADYDYFIGRAASIVNKYGKKVVGWDPYDTSTGITSSDSILQNWHCNPTTGTSAIAKGMKMILSPANAYIDQKYYANSPLGLSWRGYVNTEKAYTWDPTDFAPANSIYGIESTLWSETIVTQDNMDYMIYPRLIANAEVGWTPKSMRDWNDFKTRLNTHTTSMDYKGIKYFADPIFNTMNSAEMEKLVERFEEEGEFANHGAASALQAHLAVVDRFEKEGELQKAVKHMEEFKLLLEDQKEEELISEKAYHILKTGADYLIKKWLNLAPSATITASSEFNSNYAASKVADGTGEWASKGEQNPWIQLNWTDSQTINEITFYDRPNLADWAPGGTLTFSDGSSLEVSGIPNNGSAFTVTFPRKTVTWVKFQVSGGSGPNVGLSEIEVLGTKK
ncbi:family 20 glycosylhydrolase [Neobacillus sp. WH10]|uniref:glycoside hydrolase family 20 protein n=1 Tax=Neobacillus sp. WH10 TaxID=3047873 RepID=UPI0024C1D12B|nr:family 20 glycosylhydrolase [Neobacillus sp. WH10]WHY78448.1 family 20 glycosylhydrolase [Neobacillus sp. WH10]